MGVGVVIQSTYSDDTFSIQCHHPGEMGTTPVFRAVQKDNEMGRTLGRISLSACKAL